MDNFTLKNLILTLHPEQAESIEKQRFRLVRHTMSNRTDDDWSGLDEIIKFDQEFLRVFTAEQSGKKFNENDIIIMFVATSSTRCMLAGAFHCRGEITKQEYINIYANKYNEYMSYKKKQNIVLEHDKLIFYNLTKVAILSELNNRLIIDWGRSTQSWIQRDLNKTIWEIYPKGFISKFPGWEDVFITHQELTAIIANPDGNKDWYQFLTEHDGVYVILDTHTRKKYVGSAYGQNYGIWGRWAGYAKTGHNFNLGLEELLKDDPSYCRYFRYSLNHVCARSSKSADEVRKYEQLLKKKLATLGDEELNRN